MEVRHGNDKLPENDDEMGSEIDEVFSILN